jgi:hypothetical protein
MPSIARKGVFWFFAILIISIVGLIILNETLTSGATGFNLGSFKEVRQPRMAIKITINAVIFLPVSGIAIIRPAKMVPRRMAIKVPNSK